MDAINRNKHELFNITVEAIESGCYQATTYSLSSEKSLKIEFDLKSDNSREMLCMLDPLNAESMPKDELVELGSILYQKFTGDNVIGEEYRARLNDAYRENIDLQICLDIKPSELDALPWEDLIESMPTNQNCTEQGNYRRQEIRVDSITQSTGIAIGPGSKSTVLIFNLLALDSQTRPPTKPRQMPTIEGFVGSEEGFIGRKIELACYREKLDKLNFAIIVGMAGVGKTALTIQLAEQFMGAKLAEINVSTDVLRRNIFWHDFLEDGASLNSLMTSLAKFLYVHGNKQLWELVQADEKEINIKSELIYALSQQPFLLCLDNFPTLNQEDDPLSTFVKQLCDIASADGLWIILNSYSLPPFVQQLSDHKSLDGFNLTDTGDFLRQLGVNEAEEYHKQIHKITEGNAQLLTLLSNAISSHESIPQLLDRLIDNLDIENFLLQKVHDNLTPEEKAIMKAVAIFRNYPDTKNVIEAMLTGYKAELEIKPTLIQLRRRHLLIEESRNNKRIYRQHSTVQPFYYDLLGDGERLDMHYHAAKYYENQDRDTFRSAIHYQKAGKNKSAARVIVKNDVWTHIILGHATPLLETLQKIDKENLQLETCIKLEVVQGELHAYLHEMDKAEECFDSALLKLSGNSGLLLPELEARICLKKSEVFDHRSNDQALEWLELGLETLNDIKDKSKAVCDVEIELNIKMGSIYLAKGDYDAAAQFSQTGLSLSSHAPNRKQAIAHLNLGTVYYYKEDIRRGREEIQRSIDICEQINDQYWLVNALMNLGILCFQANEHKEAFKIMEERLPPLLVIVHTSALVEPVETNGSLRQTQEAEWLPLLEYLDSIKIQANYELNIGYMYFLVDDDVNARHHLEKSRQLSKDHELLEMRISVLHSLAELEMKGGVLHVVESYLKEASDLITETGTDGLSDENQYLQHKFNSIKGNMEHQPILNSPPILTE